MFQIAHLYEPYKAHIRCKLGERIKYISYEKLRKWILDDGFMSTHVLSSDDESSVYFVIWDYRLLQEKWAKENKVRQRDLYEILIAQIEQIKPDVIYNMSTQYINHCFFKKLSYRPILTCWNADAGRIMANKDLESYDVFYTSSVIAKKKYFNAVLHYPAYDKNMIKYYRKNKKLDLYFYGQFSKGLFDERNEYLLQIHKYLTKNSYNYRLALMLDTWQVPIINRRYLWKIPWLQKGYPPRAFIRSVSKPDFGSEMYKNIGESKIVFNASGGLRQFGNYRFNMRIFETLGVGSFLLSDAGIYPENLISGLHFDTYSNVDELKEKIKYYLTHEKERERIALKGHEAIKKFYSKERQLSNFKRYI